MINETNIQKLSKIRYPHTIVFTYAYEKAYLSRRKFIITTWLGVRASIRHSHPHQLGVQPYEETI
jgi:hypothetical protein